MYACLECGYVHKADNIVRERVDEDVDNCKGVHGFKTWRVCPECGYRHKVKFETDKV